MKNRPRIQKRRTAKNKHVHDKKINTENQRLLKIAIIKIKLLIAQKAAKTRIIKGYKG